MVQRTTGSGGAIYIQARAWCAHAPGDVREIKIKVGVSCIRMITGKGCVLVFSVLDASDMPPLLLPYIRHFITQKGHA